MPSLNRKVKRLIRKYKKTAKIVISGAFPSQLELISDFLILRANSLNFLTDHPESNR